MGVSRNSGEGGGFLYASLVVTPGARSDGDMLVVDAAIFALLNQCRVRKRVLSQLFPAMKDRWMWTVEETILIHCHRRGFRMVRCEFLEALRASLSCSYVRAASSRGSDGTAS